MSMLNSWSNTQAPGFEVMMRLRRETEDNRRALDSHPRMQQLCTGAPTKKQYLDSLKRFYGFFCPLEWKLQRPVLWNSLDIDAEARRKVPLLLHDLAYLGLGETELNAIPFSSHVPDVTTLSEIFGCMYVLESATLGGMVISDNVRLQLGYSQLKGASYFASYGAEVGPMWREWVATLGALCENESLEGDVVVASACATFDAMWRSLSE